MGRQVNKLRSVLSKLSRVKYSYTASAVQLATQVVGVVTLLVGVSMYSVPCALILGGLTLVFAIERQEL